MSVLAFFFFFLFIYLSFFFANASQLYKVIKAIGWLCTLEQSIIYDKIEVIICFARPDIYQNILISN